MSNFWQSGTGAAPTGEASKAFLPDYTTIPNNTAACAQIKLFEVVEMTSKAGNALKFIKITWKIANGDFKSREVQQTIWPFSGEPEQIDRALNMLMLIMKLCDFKPSHDGEPTNDDLMKMHGKVCGIKIREKMTPKKDGSGFFETNFVAEVYPAKDFVVETGVKLEAPAPKPVADSAFARNPRTTSNEFNDDEIPFF